MSLIKTIDQDVIGALKAGEKEKLTVLRGLKSDLKYRQIKEGAELTDEQVLEVLTSAAKKRRESIEQFRNGGREDLVAKESRELAVIEAYLPKQLSEEELRAIVQQAVAESGAASPKDMGLVMKVLMPRVKGLADGKLVSRLVTELLAK
ncbi:MAG: GatB/YqeY domain-containing protein [candidate division Zixibacteria bacterium]|nr:GatB/YqeY domain-containing protein [candidate division Zixibacteria bacterium]